MIFCMIITRIPVIKTVMNGGGVNILLSNKFKGIFLHKYYFPLWYLSD